MVGIGGSGMHVRDLHKGEQRQQYQANERGGAQSPGLAADPSLVITEVQIHPPLVQEYTD
jgi:hypothetical protein